MKKQVNKSLPMVPDYESTQAGSYAVPDSNLRVGFFCYE